MTTESEHDALEPDGDGPIKPGADGGAGMAEEGAPIGFTAEVGGAGAESSDDPAELSEYVFTASEEGSASASEREERGEQDDGATS
jgi:hypothetical protein